MAHEAGEIPIVMSDLGSCVAETNTLAFCPLVSLSYSCHAALC